MKDELLQEWFNDLLEEWNDHQVKHRCYYVEGPDAGSAECPSVYGYFDKFVESRLDSLDPHDLFEFLVNKPDVRISGRVSDLLDFRSTSEKNGFPVVPFSQLMEDADRALVRPRRKHREAPVSAEDNSEAHGPQDSERIILQRIETTLNNIDKSLARLVESVDNAPVVIAVDPSSGRAFGRLLQVREWIKDALRQEPVDG